MLAGKRDDTHRETCQDDQTQIGSMKKGTPTEQATMKSTPHATYLENGRRQHMASGQHNGWNTKYKCTSKTRHEEHEVDLGDVRVYM